MTDVVTLVWVSVIFFAAVFFASISIVHLFQNKKMGFDKGFNLSLSACLASVMLCLSIWPPLHRVYDDEFAYTSQSINILSSGKPSMTLIGSRLQPEVFASWMANTKLPGFACLEAVILFLTRDFEHSYFILNIILGTLSVAAVYRIAWLWSASQSMAWWSAIFWACLPARITYSMSAASDITGSLFFFLFLLFISEYRNQQSKRILYAALFCGVYSICIKQFYGIFVFPGLAAALYIYRRNSLLDKKLCPQIVLNTVCIILPVLCAVPFMLLSDSKAQAYSFSFILKNLHTSISYLFNYEQNTLLTALAALLAVGKSIFYKKDNLVTGLAGWFLTGLLMISAFCAGGISYPGSAYSDRYILSIAFPFVFLAAKGMVDTVTKVESRLLGALFFIMLVVNASFASHHLAAEAKNNFFYKKIFLLKQMVQSIPHEAYILDESAALITTISSRKSIQTDLFLGGNHPEKVVFLQGIPGDLYNPDDPKRMVMLKNVLDTGYRCVPLVATPFKERDLSATPYLCIRKQDHR